VICGDGFSYAIPAAMLKRLGLLRARLIVRYIGGDILYNSEAELGRKRTPLVDWLIRQGIAAADGLRPVSPLLADVLMREGADASRLKVCPSPLPAAPDMLAGIHSDRAARDAVRHRYGFQPHTPVVITLSNNQKGKGVHLMAAAWPIVLRAVPQARWLLAGPSHPWLDEGVWPELRKQPEFMRSVIATGALERDAAFAHLAAADLNVNPTLCDGLNMVAVEAAAVGTPTVTSDGAGVAAWVSQYGAGAVVRTGDVDELAAAVAQALLDPHQTSNWGANCSRMAEGFSLERVARHLVAR
jgi:glycosyltransferase involved in cell wall biosynthesis